MGRGTLAGKVVVFIGRLDAMSQRGAAAYVTSAGGVVRRGLSRATTHVVVGHAAHTLIEDGVLSRRLERARRHGALCLSETAFLRMIGAASDESAGPRSFTLQTLAAQAGISLETAELLALFDIIDPRDDKVSFADLVAAKEVARLLGDEMSLAEIVASAARIRGHGAFAAPLARARLERTGEGVMGIRVGGVVADLDGQMPLLLGNPGNPTVQELYEAAEAAEEAGDEDAAEQAYRRCLDLDPREPTAAFNLGNIYRNGGRITQARLCLHFAVAIDPGFAEAWYNLASLEDEAGNIAEARAHLEKAVAADATYADALYNLANLCFREGAYAEAVNYWQRYLSVDSESAWSQKARDGLALCRRQLQGA